MNARVLALVALVLSVALLGAAPQPKPATVPSGPQTQAVTAYLNALKRDDYASAYAMLAAKERAYFRNVQNFASTYSADALHLRSFTLVGARGDDRGRVFFARESLGFYNHLKNERFKGDLVVPLGAIDEHGWKVRDLGHPWKAYPADVTQNVDDLRVQIRKVSFFERRIEVIVNFANLGSSFVSVLPYGKSVLRDDKGGVYRILATKDPVLTDRQLFIGLRLAPSAQYTGALQFETPVLADGPRAFTLTVAPFLRDGSDAPGEVSFSAIPPSPIPQ